MGHVRGSATPATRRTIIIGAVIAVFTVGLAFGVYNAVALPGCVSCHDEGAFGAATRSAAHAGVDCASCHVPDSVTGRFAFGFRQAYHMTVPIVSGRGREWETVPDARCLACHEDVQSATVSANGVRISHALCATDERCSDCHAATAHGGATTWARTYDMETCLGCHVSQGAAECDLCHDGRLPADRVTTGVFAITHGPQWESTHGMGDSATCIACHTAASCEKCHGVGLPHSVKYVERHAADAARPEARCGSCHETSTFCDGCHGLPMPHPAGFTEGHAALAEADQRLCDRCHADPDCTRCHEMHVHPGGAIGTLEDGGGER